jgi:hypothetical protein
LPFLAGALGADLPVLAGAFAGALVVFAMITSFYFYSTKY